MSYRLNIHHPLAKNTRCIVSEQIDKAINELSGSRSTSTTTAIHETRKRIKRIRAVLKLVRPGLDAKTYHHENDRFRKISAQLSSSRDSAVLDETLQKLALNDVASLRGPLRAARALVKRQRDHTAPVTLEAMETTRLMLSAALADSARISFTCDRSAVVRDGLRSCYHKARRAQKMAYRHGSDESFHDWRKPVQLHWRHMALFSSAWPALFKARIELARTLSQCLGDDHDLTVLISFVKAASKTRDLSKSDARALIDCARQRQQVLRETANPIGQVLFQQPAKAHAKHVYGIWTASRDMSPHRAAKTRAKQVATPATPDAS